MLRLRRTPAPSMTTCGSMTCWICLTWFMRLHSPLVTPLTPLADKHRLKRPSDRVGESPGWQSTGQKWPRTRSQYRDSSGYCASAQALRGLVQAEEPRSRPQPVPPRQRRLGAATGAAATATTGAGAGIADAGGALVTTGGGATAADGEGRRRPDRRIDAERLARRRLIGRAAHMLGREPAASRAERATLDPGRQSRAALAAKLPLLGDAAMAAGNKLPFAQPAALRAAAPNDRFPAPGTCQLSRLFLRKPVAHSFTPSSQRFGCLSPKAVARCTTRKPTLQSR